MTEVEVKEIVVRLDRLQEEMQRLAEKVDRLAPPQRPTIGTGHPHIVRVEGLKGGEPIVRGASVTVRTVVLLTQQGQTPEQIVEDFDGVLTLSQIYDALSYYYEHRQEIEGYIAYHDAALAEVERSPSKSGSQAV